jgi:hypothetical protein
MARSNAAQDRLSLTRSRAAIAHQFVAARVWEVNPPLLKLKPQDFRHNLLQFDCSYHFERPSCHVLAREIC